MFDYSLEQLITIFVSSFFIGFSKTSGIHFAPAIIPFFSNIFPVKTSTGILCLAFFFASFQALKLYYKDIQYKYFKILLPTTAVGFAIGGWALHYFEDNNLRLIICFICLSMLVFNLGKNYYVKSFERISESKSFDLMCGLLIGIASTIANVGTPILIIYLLAKKEEKRALIGTQVAFFSLLNVVKIIFYTSTGIITVTSVKVNVIMFPLALVGGAAGYLFIKWIAEERFKHIVLLISGLSILKLGWSAL